MTVYSPLLVFKEISKSFGNHAANQSVSFSVEAGTFHGIVGENGAGKSTIMNVLYGMFQRDSGEIFFNGEPIFFRKPADAIRSGIGMVHQHFMQVPSLTVWENIILGQEPIPYPVRPNRLIKELNALKQQFGFSLNLESLVEDLGVGEQQQVELLKLLYRKSQLFILDEPTALLTPQESDSLFKQLHFLQEKGHTVILISHKLKEILKHTDRVTVMREGRVVATKDTNSLTPESLATLIMGESRSSWIKPTLSALPTPVLLLKSVKTYKRDQINLSSLNLTLYPGEIVGIAGMEGQGQDTLVEVLAQLCPFSGTISFLGNPLEKTAHYRKRQEGFSLIPPNRQHEALVPEMNQAENLLLGHHRESRYLHRGWFHSESILKEAQKRIEEFDVRPSTLEAPVKHLSGGNQQKLVFARETDRNVKLLIACHPTRGVDIRSSDAIYQRLVWLAQQGSSILLISSDLDELLNVSTRLIVLRSGRAVFETKPESTSPSELGLWMTGAHS